MLVRGMPSMHIYLDMNHMIDELLALPQLEQTRSPALYPSVSSGARHQKRVSAQALAADGRARARSDSVSSTASTASGLEMEMGIDWEPSTSTPESGRGRRHGRRRGLGRRRAPLAAGVRDPSRRAPLHAVRRSQSAVRRALLLRRDRHIPHLFVYTCFLYTLFTRTSIQYIHYCANLYFTVAQIGT